MSDNEEVSLIRSKKRVVKSVTENTSSVPVALEEMVSVKENIVPVIAKAEQPKKQRPPKTEKQLEASKKMLEARRLQCEKIKEEKLAKQYEAYKKCEATVLRDDIEPRSALSVAEPSVKEEQEEDNTETEEEIVVIKKPKTTKKTKNAVPKKKKIVIVQESESESESEEEEEITKRSEKPKIKQNFGKSQQNIKSKISVGNQKQNWDNYFC